MGRTTFLVGAGAPLDLKLPNGYICPSTKNITADVTRDYINYLDRNVPITLGKDIYEKLMESFPPGNDNPWSDREPTPNIHFEHIFHVLEMLYSYAYVWDGTNKNPRIFPVFAPFTSANFNFHKEHLNQVMSQFIERIMDIVNGYDSYFRQNDPENMWYREFYERFRKGSDFFILNYDTTIEESIGEYVDGFADDGIQSEFKRFNPSLLMADHGDISTVNHLHGCILYNFQRYADINQDAYTFRSEDFYKFSGYAEMKRRRGSGRSPQSTQSGEQFFVSPIITGLNKTEKLNSLPFDFYHANLFNATLKNKRLVIIGYSFGDLYCNQLIERINFLHEKDKKIVLIDFWDIPKAERKWHGGYFLDQEKGRFICKASHIGDFDSAVADLYKNEDKQTGALYSSNGSLMVLPNGFKHAAKAIDAIISFLS